MKNYVILIILTFLSGTLNSFGKPINVIVSAKKNQIKIVFDHKIREKYGLEGLQVFINIFKQLDGEKIEFKPSVEQKFIQEKEGDILLLNFDQSFRHATSFELQIDTGGEFDDVILLCKEFKIAR